MERAATVVTSFNDSLCQKTSNMRERDASFSSYLKPKNEPIINGSSSSSYGSRQEHHHIGRVNDSTEISIFDAKKYFNDVSNCESQKPTNNNNRVSPVINVNIVSNLEQIPEQCDPNSLTAPRFSSASSSVDGYSNYSRNYRARSFHASTPTASSEASWNSQTGLLSNPPGAAISVSVMRESNLSNVKSNRRSPSTPRWIFRSPRCPCSGKKSVRVEESKASEPKSPPLSSYAHNSRNSLNIKRAELKTSNSENEQWGQKRFGENQVIGIPNRFSATEDRFSSNLLMQGQSQRVLASARPFVEHHASTLTTGTTTAGFSFPILNNANSPSSSAPLTLRLNGGLPVASAVPPARTRTPAIEEDPPRDSLEVYRLIDESIQRKTNSRDCQVNVKFLGSPKSRMIPTAAATGVDDDVASDASSDLFEIESFSTQTTTYPTIFCHRRDSLEEERRSGGARRSLDEPMTPSSIAATEWYEPSEASIDWSVTTADGFDRASCVTNFSMAGSAAEEILAIGRRTEHERSSRRVSSSGNGLLMSCRNEKAVSVGPQPLKYETFGEERGRTIGPPMAVNSRIRHVGSRPPLAIGMNKPPVSRPQSNRLSHAFAA